MAEQHDKREGGAANWPRRCVVTGANGFIGGRLMARWAAAGRKGHAGLVRRPESAHGLQRQGVQALAADLLKPADLDTALVGSDAVVHLAHGDRGPEATRNLLRAMAKAGIRRLVHISTMSVHGPAPGPEAAHEATATIGRYGNDYCDSKAEQEELVWKAHHQGDLQCVVLRPTVVYGPGSGFVTQVVDQARQGQVSWIDEGSGCCNAVYVDDVCAAIDAALVSSDALGQAFFVNGVERITWRRFIESFASGQSAAPRFVNIPSVEAAAYWRAHAAQPATGLFARVSRKVLHVLGNKPAPAPFPPLGRVQRETIQVMFSPDKAREILQWTPEVNFDQGVERTRAWLHGTGLLP